VAASALMLAGLALSPAGWLPQGFCVVGWRTWFGRGVSGFGVQLQNWWWLGWCYRQQAGSHSGFCVVTGIWDWPRGFRGFSDLGQRGRLSGFGGMDQCICSVELPSVLMLLPTCNACYTSAIDKPSGH
jgi:hypothetical protein